MFDDEINEIALLAQLLDHDYSVNELAEAAKHYHYVKLRDKKKEVNYANTGRRGRRPEVQD